MRFLLVFIWIFMISFLGLTQEKEGASRLPLSLRHALSSSQDNLPTHLFVKADEASLENWLNEHEGTIKYSFKGYHAIVLPASDVVMLGQVSFVKSIHFEWAPGHPLLSASLEHTSVTAVHQGTNNLPSSYTGAGVIVGVIDAGIELQHPDFMYPDSTTRIIELWDQTLPFDAQLTPSYGYGQIWDSASINAGICPHQDQAQWFGHGTNTAGIAAGKSHTNNDFIGYAPDAELIVVSSNFAALGWTNTVADAVAYIFDRAEQLGRPCVINTSLGTYLGSHDASDLAATLIEEKITEAEGRVMVCAAGNSGDQFPYHLGYEASSDTTFTWFEFTSTTPVGQGLLFLELYGDKNDFERIQFSVGADAVSPEYSFRGATRFDSVLNRLEITVNDTLWSLSGNELGVLQTWADSLNGVYRLQLLMANIDSVDYNYRLQITGSGRFDLWSSEFLGMRNMVTENLPSAQAFPPIVNYRSPDILQSIVSSWACSDKVITVGNYVNRNSYVDVDGNTITIAGVEAGQIAANSSYGPARNQSVKPEISAPGDYTLTAGAFFQLNNLLNIPSERYRVAPGGLHHRAGGTSSASPAVAGIAALFLEKCPKANWGDFKEAVIETAYDDAYTGSLPNHQWGYGKVNGLESLKHTTPSADVSASATEICEGDSVQLSIAFSDSILWVTGSNQNSIEVREAGQYYATLVDELGCTGYSDTASVFVRPLPTMPSIVLGADTPACFGSVVPLSVETVYGGYHWSNGAFSDKVEVHTSGNYWVDVFNQYGCSQRSEALYIHVFDEQPPSNVQLGVDDQLILLTEYPAPLGYRWMFNLEELSDDSTAVLIADEVGVYNGAYVDSNACMHWSEPFTLYALGSSNRNIENVRLYPNPVEDNLYIQTNLELPLQYHVTDVTGRIVESGASNKGFFIIDFHQQPPGNYHLRLESKQDVIVKQVVK